MLVEQPVMQQMKEIEDKCNTTELSPQQLADMALTASDELLPACQQFGQVYSGQVHPEKCYVTCNGLETATVNRAL